ncbi:carboxypeptidase B-like [Cydia amplana]|uniref:carboxypeptidase B-like n=1 Tax=Cydia amplana TaxID=1869771 RepID=UPI002FE538D4
MKDGQKMFLKNLEGKGAIHIVRETKNSMELMVDGNRKLQLGKLLESRSITYAVSSDRMPPPYYPAAPKLHSRNNSPKTRPISPYCRLSYNSSNFNKRVLDWKDFYPLHFINDFMIDLEKQYPSTCTVISLGKTAEGRDIKVLKVSNSDAGNSGVWIDGAIHAREWISASVVTYIVNHVVRHFTKSSKHITNKDWYFAPVLNPDGYEYSHSTDRMWRKNRSRLGNKIVGVDLNRNFGNTWTFTSQDCEPTHLNYPGTHPFSEPECAAVKDLILYSGIRFKIFLTFHAYSELISFPWCFTNVPCPDYVTLLEGATVITKAMYDTTGRMYKVGNFRDLMYHAEGTSIDWSYGVANIPFSYLVELRSKEHKFLLPKEQIIDCCKESLSGVLALAEFVDKKKF